MKWLLYPFLLFNVNCLLAEVASDVPSADASYLVLRPILYPKELVDLSSQLEKAILSRATKQTQYGLLLAQDEDFSIAQKKHHQLQIDFKNTAKGFHIEATLMDLKRDVLLMKVKREGASVNTIIRDTETAIDLLFIKLKEKKAKELLTQNPGVIKSETILEGNEVKREKAVTQKNLSDKGLTALREQVIELKNKVKKDLAQKRDVASKKKKTQDELVENKVIKKTGEEPKILPEDKLSSLTQKSFSRMGVIIYQEENLSKDLLTVSHNEMFAGIEYEGGRQLWQSDWSLLYSFAYAKIFTDIKYEVPDYQAIGLGIKRPLFLSQWYGSGGLIFDTFGFVNLPSERQNLQLSLSNLLWAEGELQAGVELFKLHFLGRFSYSSLILNKTEYGRLSDVNMGGSRLKMGLVVAGFLKGLEVYFGISHVNINGSAVGPFTVTSTRSHLEAVYNF